MAEGTEAVTKIKTDLVESGGDDDVSSGKTQPKGSIHPNISQERENCLTVEEIIRAVQKPISIYVDQIVKAFHEKLGNDLLAKGKCKISVDCNKKTKASELCTSCRGWFDKLKESHESNGNNPSWLKNCDCSKWSEDRWEVAKFFMPPLGGNRNTVKDAESTDLSSLLNVLIWMKDDAFLGETRVNVDFAKELRSQVRNTWAHAPKLELSDDEKKEGFVVATKFLKDLENVYPNAENGQCLKNLEDLKANGVTNVAKSELQSLLLQCDTLKKKSLKIEEEITKMKTERGALDKDTIEEKELKKLQCALNECSQRALEFESREVNNTFSAEELKSLRSIPKDIHEMRDYIEQIRVDVAKMNNCQNKQSLPRSCLPDKLEMFTGREDEIQKVISFLMDHKKASVSLHGGPGFGKTAIAETVSHKLNEDHHITVVLSDLSTATSVDEMILRLCRDAGVQYEDDPKSSLILWLKNITDKIVFVMDDIDILLEEKASFFDFVRLMRKNSNRYCQIVTTSRTRYEIPELTAEVEVIEMDSESCMALLKKKCSEQDKEFLQRLAKLCGYIPLAMCIASSRVDDFENANDLLQYLERKPMEVLQCPKRDQFVYRAISMSYEKSDDQQKETLVRLALFEGSFSETAAGAVIEKDQLNTKKILKNLVQRSLIKQPTPHRFSIHLLIKHFLIDQLKSEKENTERARAGSLMVGYYLKLGHDLTMKSYSKDGYKDSREALKTEAHNIQNILKICCQQNTTSDISNYVVETEVYTTSARFVSLFVRTIIPGPTVDEFLEWCAKLAEDRKQHDIKINFDCLLVGQHFRSVDKNDKINKKMEVILKDLENHYKKKSFWAYLYYLFWHYFLYFFKSVNKRDKFKKMEVILKDLENHDENKSFCAHLYYHLGHYFILSKSKEPVEERSDWLRIARKYLKKSLEIRRELTDTSVEKADNVFSLLQLAKVWKTIATHSNDVNDKKACDEATKKAEEYYKQAIELSQSELGEHELTSACYKQLGDSFLSRHINNEAEKYYNKAKEMRENLGLDSSAKYVFLLNNLGITLTYSKREDEAIEILESACDTAEKLFESDEPNMCKAKVYTSLAVAHNSIEKSSENAIKYAKKAMEFEKLEKVIQKGTFKVVQLILSSN